ncbi:MAG: hypothetical protein AVDCRST_MAG73-182, partial [uncultured Thermomicrobiales bacterium]
ERCRGSPIRAPDPTEDRNRRVSGRARRGPRGPPRAGRAGRARRLARGDPVAVGRHDPGRRGRLHVRADGPVGARIGAELAGRQAGPRYHQAI